MFVSILQRFGFKVSSRVGQPLQSRADQQTRPVAQLRNSGEVHHPEAVSQRRQAVQAKSAKSTKVIKAPSKPAASAKKAALPAKPATVKSVVKSGPKAVVKPAPKAPVKTTAKVAVKAKVQTKSTAKPLAKPLAKPIAKPIAKTAAKKVDKTVAQVKPTLKKPVSKPAAKAAPVKAKAPSKVVAKQQVKVSPKVAPRAEVKLVSKPVAKPVPKTVIKTAKSKPVLTSTAPAAAAPVAPPKPVVSSNGLPPPPPLKPGRRSSSRALAHMPPPAPMVPTHAPDAAKASYSTMTERVIAPPPHVAAKKDPKLANNWKTKTAQTLTDDEVKAMPDAEYMNDMQMAFFRHKLSILKQEIHNSAGATTEHLREDTAVVPDPADRATIEEEHALELRTRDRERKLLKKIEQSIDRIDSGDYGYCDETGEPIGVGRLIARPTASLSLEAQQRRELKQKMFGD